MNTRSMIDDHLGSDEVLIDFDSDNVYDIMDQKYIECTDSYEDSMAYLENPFEKFTAYTEELGEKLNNHLEENYLEDYKDEMQKNIMAFIGRLEKL